MRNSKISMMLVAATVLASACGKKGAGAAGDDRCVAAYTRMQAMSGAMGGGRYGGGDQAISFGASCAKFTDDDLKCLDSAKSANDVAGCHHVAEVLSAQRKDMRTIRGGEQRMGLRKIAMAAAAYYNTNKVLPASAPLTPAEDCCAGGKGGKCAPGTEWTAPTWAALSFAMVEPHSFRYEFVSSAAGYTARAIGDLACDGKKTVWEITGSIDDEHKFLKRGDMKQTDGPKPEGPSLAQVQSFVDKICACTDDACLVSLGRTDGSMFANVFNYDPADADKAAAADLKTKLRECRKKLRKK